MCAENPPSINNSGLCCLRYERAVSGSTQLLELVAIVRRVYLVEPAGDPLAEKELSLLRSADGVIFVADSQEPRREHNVYFLDRLREDHGALSEVPIVFQLNKRDTPKAADIEVLAERPGMLARGLVSLGRDQGDRRRRSRRGRGLAYSRELLTVSWPGLASRWTDGRQTPRWARRRESDRASL